MSDFVVEVGNVMNDVATIILTLLGGLLTGGGLVALIAWLRFRKKDRAETEQIVINTKETAVNTEKLAAETEQIKVSTKATEVAHYQGLVDKLVVEVKELKIIIEAAQEKYERRVGSLHEQLDRLATELGRANTQLETANKTIEELRDVITKLRGEITQLLVDKAETKKEG